MLIDVRWINRPRRSVSTYDGAIILSPNAMDIQHLQASGIPIIASAPCNLGIPNLIVANSDAPLRNHNATVLKTSTLLPIDPSFFKPVVCVRWYLVKADDPNNGTLFRVQYRMADLSPSAKIPLQGKGGSFTLDIYTTIVLAVARQWVSPEEFATLLMNAVTWTRRMGLDAPVATTKSTDGIFKMIRMIEDRLYGNRDINHFSFFQTILADLPNYRNNHFQDFVTGQQTLRTKIPMGELLNGYQGPKIDISPCMSMWNQNYPIDRVNPLRGFEESISMIDRLCFTDFRMSFTLSDVTIPKNVVVEYAVDRYAHLLGPSRLDSTDSVRLGMLEITAGHFWINFREQYLNNQQPSGEVQVVLEKSFDDELSMTVHLPGQPVFILYFDLLSCTSMFPVDCINIFRNQSLYKPLETTVRDVDSWY